MWPIWTKLGWNTLLGGTDKGRWFICRFEYPIVNLFHRVICPYTPFLSVNVLKSSPALPHDLPHLQNGRQMTLEKFHVDCFVCFGQYSTMLKLLGRKLQSVNLRLKLQLLLNDSGVIFQPNDWKPEHITSKYSAAVISYLLGKIDIYFKIL